MATLVGVESGALPTLMGMTGRAMIDCYSNRKLVVVFFATRAYQLPVLVTGATAR